MDKHRPHDVIEKSLREKEKHPKPPPPQARPTSKFTPIYPTKIGPIGGLTPRPETRIPKPKPFSPYELMTPKRAIELIYIGMNRETMQNILLDGEFHVKTLSEEYCCFVTRGFWVFNKIMVHINLENDCVKKIQVIY